MIGVSENQNIIKNSLFMMGREKNRLSEVEGRGVGVCVGNFDLFCLPRGS